MIEYLTDDTLIDSPLHSNLNALVWNQSLTLSEKGTGYYYGILVGKRYYKF
jgi:hypothetical protein